MSAPSEQEIQAAVDMAGKKHATGIEKAIDDWLYDVLHGALWQRWSCEDERCPARPEYDKALSDLFNETIGIETLVEGCLNVVNDRFVVALREFAKKYPDAPRAKEEAA